MATTSAVQGSTTSSSSTSAPNAFSSLNSEDFIKIIFSELSKQDPLKPNDTDALLQQMSSLRSIQSDIDISNKLQSVVTQDQLSTAGALLGKTVSGLTDSYEHVQGVVKSVAKTDAGPVLILADGSRIGFNSIDQLLDTTPTPSTGTNSNTGGG